jgi:hypothetical protein
MEVRLALVLLTRTAVNRTDFRRFLTFLPCLPLSAFPARCSSIFRLFADTQRRRWSLVYLIHQLGVRLYLPLLFPLSRPALLPSSFNID